MIIYLAGKNGLVGNALCEYYKHLNEQFIATSSAEVDLTNTQQTMDFIEKVKPDVIILSAAKHGGIKSYSENPLEYYRDNVAISTNVINAAAKNGVKTLINIGASCVYAEEIRGPLKEEHLFWGPVQKATEPYGLAKAVGMKLCEYYNTCRGLRYISLLPVNLYGDGIGYQVDTSTVIPAMMSRFHDAVMKNYNHVDLWGSGLVKREFLHVSDFVEAIHTIIKSTFHAPYINIGYGEMHTINDVAEIIREISGYSGEIVHDLSKPEGAQRERLDCSKIYSLGWQPKIKLREGLRNLYCNLYGTNSTR